MQMMLSSLLFMFMALAAAVLGLHLVRRRFPHHIRQANNEVAGFFIAVLGAIYAVLLAFVVITVWDDYTEARRTTQREANEIVDVYRLAQGLPAPVAARVGGLAQAYVTAAIDNEWPAMERGQQDDVQGQVLAEIWDSVTVIEGATEEQRVVQAELLDRLGELNDARRLRQLTADEGVPELMWVLLIGGGIVTVVFTYFFSTPNPRAQYLMTALYTASITFVVALIGLLDYPFRGDIRILPEAFGLALKTITGS
jgi:hypothetical protein